MTARKPEKLSLQGVPAPVPEVVEAEVGPEVDVIDAEGFRAVLVAAERVEYARINEVIRETREAIAIKDAEHQAEMIPWKAAAEKALEEYRVPPEAPAAPDTRQERALLEHLQHRLGAVADREKKVLGWSRLQVETAWQEARQELAVKAAGALKDLEEVQALLGPWHGLILDSRRADEQSKGSYVTNGDSQRTKQHLDLTDVIELAKGVDVLKPEPLPRSRVEAIPHDEDRAEMRRVDQRIEADRVFSIQKLRG